MDSSLYIRQPPPHPRSPSPKSPSPSPRIETSPGYGPPVIKKEKVVI